MPPFDRAEYADRLRRVRERMAAQGIDVLVSLRPANMHYLTGYDGWSFYTPQGVLVPLDGRPLCSRALHGRQRRKRHDLPEAENILGYPDHYVQNPRPPPARLGRGRARRARARRGTSPSRSTPTTSPPPAYARAQAGPARRALRRCRRAGQLGARREVAGRARVDAPGGADHRAVMAQGDRRRAARRPPVRRRGGDLHAQISGAPEYGGDYTSFVPMLPTGVGTSTPHLTWSDASSRPARRRSSSSAPAAIATTVRMARTVFLGRPPQKLVDTARSSSRASRPRWPLSGPGALRGGRGRVARRDRRHGLEKESRIGYSVGINYPPDWGEHTMSLRPGDKTVLSRT